MGVEAQSPSNMDDLEVMNIGNDCLITEVASVARTDPTVAELENRLRSRNREVQVIQQHLRRYGVDSEELMKQQNAQLSAMTAKDSKITLLERRVSRLEETITEKDKQIDKLTTSISDYDDKHSAANILRTHVADTVAREDNLRKLIAAESATKNKMQSSENDLLLQRIVKLKNTCKNIKRRHEAYTKTTENQLMFDQDKEAHAEAYAMKVTGELFDMKKRTSLEHNKHQTPQGYNIETVQVEFTDPDRLASVDDEFIEQIAERSQHSRTLMTFKKDLSNWVYEFGGRLTSVMKLLYKQTDTPKTRNSRNETGKTINEIQRKVRISVRELSRSVNKLITSVLEVERSTAKKFAASYETEKFSNRNSESTQCDIPGPPDPIIDIQKKLLLKATQTQETLNGKLKAMRKERDDYCSKYNTAIEEYWSIHNTMHQTFRAVWTHRYRFIESLEDPVRVISKRLSENDSKRRSVSGPDPAQAHEHLRKVFAKNVTEVSKRDIDVLEQFGRYITSDILYKMDMVTHGRQKREEEARRKNAEASYAQHSSPKRSKSEAGSVGTASPNATKSEASPSVAGSPSEKSKPEKKKKPSKAAVKTAAPEQQQSPRPQQQHRDVTPPPPEPVIEVGCRVRAQNLQLDNWRWLNGTMGTVIGIDSSGRYNVCFSTGTYPMAASNLKLLGAARPSLVIQTKLPFNSESADENGPDSARTQPTPRSSMVPKAPDAPFIRLSPRVVESHTKFSPSAGVLTSSAAVSESSVKTVSFKGSVNGHTNGSGSGNGNGNGNKQNYPPLQLSNSAFVRFATDGYDRKGSQLRSSALVSIRGMRVSNAF